MSVSQVENIPEELGSYYPRHIDDIAHVSQTLLRCLQSQSVPHVINSVIDFAEYWLCLASKRDERHRTGFRRASAFRISEQSPCKDAYVLTAPIHRSGGRLQPAIKRIRIWITGKDQGWCTASDGGSWTWWVVVRQSSEGHAYWSGTPENGSELPDSWEEGPELVRNEQAGNDFKTYLVEAASHDGSELAKWISTLRPMDIVGVRPKARFPGWMCNTMAVKIEVYAAEYAF